jgi:phytoene dehydrogenase-like protein
MGTPFDVVVIGAGFGGLATALRLSELGLRVALRERLSYPGGCASTFGRHGYRFEAGATLFSGFGPGQLFERWIRQHELAVQIAWLDPVVSFRTPAWSLEVPRSRGALCARFLELPGAPRAQLQRFFAEQGRVADALWSVLDDPELLPPLSFAALLRHARRMPRYGALLRRIGRPLEHVVRSHGLAEFEPLCTFLNAVAQITVQCGMSEAEAPMALATLDYFSRGTGHVKGGIGKLAEALATAAERQSVDVRFADAVKAVRRRGDGLFDVTTRKGTLRARHVVANLLPAAARALLGMRLGEASRIDALDRGVARGWGACMLYAVLRAPPGVGDDPHHVQIVQDTGSAYLAGNHLFCSLSGADETERAPAGHRTMTVSTHVSMDELLALPDDARATLIHRVQERMRAGLAKYLPEWWRGLVYEATASPRTFEKFTGRPHGYVGGVPRRAGLGNYRALLPRPVLPGLHLVGDTMFPGQSTLATALGGYKLAEVIARGR